MSAKKPVGREETAYLNDVILEGTNHVAVPRPKAGERVVVVGCGTVCRGCFGTGTQVQLIPHGNSRYSRGPENPCSVCGGAGETPGYMLIGQEAVQPQPLAWRQPGLGSVLWRDKEERL